MASNSWPASASRLSTAPRPPPPPSAPRCGVRQTRFRRSVDSFVMGYTHRQVVPQAGSSKPKLFERAADPWDTLADGAAIDWEEALRQVRKAQESTCSCIHLGFFAAVTHTIGTIMAARYADAPVAGDGWLLPARRWWLGCSCLRGTGRPIVCAATTCVPGCPCCLHACTHNSQLLTELGGRRDDFRQTGKPGCGLRAAAGAATVHQHSHRTRGKHTH